MNIFHRPKTVETYELPQEFRILKKSEYSQHSIDRKAVMVAFGRHSLNDLVWRYNFKFAIYPFQHGADNKLFEAARSSEGARSVLAAERREHAKTCLRSLLCPPFADGDITATGTPTHIFYLASQSVRPDRNGRRHRVDILNQPLNFGIQKSGRTPNYFAMAVGNRVLDRFLKLTAEEAEIELKSGAAITQNAWISFIFRVFYFGYWLDSHPEPKRR